MIQVWFEIEDSIDELGNEKRKKTQKHKKKEKFKKKNKINIIINKKTILFVLKKIKLKEKNKNVEEVWWSYW